MFGSFAPCDLSSLSVQQQDHIQFMHPYRTLHPHMRMLVVRPPVQGPLMGGLATAHGDGMTRCAGHCLAHLMEQRALQARMELQLAGPTVISLVKGDTESCLPCGASHCPARLQETGA